MYTVHTEVKNNLKISTYEAHQLIKRIENEINDGVVMHSSLNVFTNVNYQLWLTNSMALSANRISDLHRLIDAKKVIIRSIQEVYETSGINGMIIEEKRTSEQLRLSRSICNEGNNEPAVDGHIISRQAEKILNDNATINVFVIPPEILDNERSNIKGFEKQLDSVRNTLSKMTHDTYIELNTDVVEFLSELGIV